LAEVEGGVRVGVRDVVRMGHLVAKTWDGFVAENFTVPLKRVTGA
jgi:hypothetical protein